MSEAPPGRVEVERAVWDDPSQREEMFAIRTEVFVNEQDVPVEEELDGRDPRCVHLIARTANGRAIGTARMQQDGHIGRIAVVKAWRKHGVGSRLVHALLDVARTAGRVSVDLDSQVHAIGFYRRLGFVVRGGTFMDADIPHQNMVLHLASPPRPAAKRPWGG